MFRMISATMWTGRNSISHSVAAKSLALKLQHDHLDRHLAPDPGRIPSISNGLSRKILEVFTLKDISISLFFNSLPMKLSHSA